MALVFFILIVAMIFARFLVLTGLPGEFVDVVNEANIPTLRSMILFLVMYVFLGVFQDSISMMSITLPIVHPIIVGLGIDRVYFAMLVIMAMEIGLITPPPGGTERLHCPLSGDSDAGGKEPDAGEHL